jgi:hypothetical protein
MATSTVAKFVIMRVEELVRSGGAKIDEAVALLAKKQGPASEAALNTYRRLTKGTLGYSCIVYRISM